MTHASFQNAKFARAPMLFTISKRKICTYTRPAPNQSAICTTTFATPFARCLFHVRTQNLHVHVTDAALRHAKSARSHAPCLMSKRKICTRTQATWPPFPHAQFARRRELNITNHARFCSSHGDLCYCVRLVPVHFQTQNLHVHVAHAAFQNANFARAHAPYLKSKRKICTCTPAIRLFCARNLHLHVS